MAKSDLKRPRQEYHAPMVELFDLVPLKSILEEVSLGADIEDFEDGDDI